VNSLSTPPPSVPPPGPTLPLKVLVVDDDAGNRLLAVRWLERAGLNTVEAENGEDALSLLSTAPDDVGAVILDIMMPNMSGFEVLERMQADEALREIPVVLLTAHVQQETDVVYSLRNGAVDHLAKPFRGPILAAKMQALVERRCRQLNVDERLRRAEAQAMTDGMTGLANRRQFDVDLARETSYTARHREPLALVLVDIDNLKLINDEFGHSSGDRAITWTAEGLKNAMRRSDRGFRIGGDEFALLLRGLDRESGLRAALRFIKAQAKRQLGGESEPVRVTVSIGVAAADATNDYDVTDLFDRADRALYAAKRRPESQVEVDAS
jgi:diguanylate cyclase (GGDEF)-like protein